MSGRQSIGIGITLADVDDPNFLKAFGGHTAMYLVILSRVWRSPNPPRVSSPPVEKYYTAGFLPAYMPDSHISKKFNVTERTVLNWRRSLEESGAIITVQPGKHSPVIYIVGEWLQANTEDHWCVQYVWQSPDYKKSVESRLVAMGAVLYEYKPAPKKDDDSLKNLSPLKDGVEPEKSFTLEPEKSFTLEPEKSFMPEDSMLEDSRSEDSNKTAVEGEKPKPAPLAFFGGADGGEVKNPRALAAMQKAQARAVALEQMGIPSSRFDAIQKYPEDVWEIVASFCKFWPMNPPMPNGKGGEYAFWVKSAREIKDALGAVDPVALMQAIHTEWLIACKRPGGGYTINSLKSVVSSSRRLAGELAAKSQPQEIKKQAQAQPSDEFPLTPEGKPDFSKMNADQKKAYIANWSDMQ